MTTTTSDQQLIIPVNTDLNDVPTHISNLILGSSNNGLESRLFKRYASVADRTARNATPSEGEVSFLLDLNEIDVYDGATWQFVWSGRAPRGIMAAPTTSNANGTATSGTTETRDAVLGDYVFTAAGGRRYQVFYNNGKLNGGAADDLYETRIRDGGGSTPTAASTLIAATAMSLHLAGGTGQTTINVTGTWVPAAGTRTLSLFTVRISGTGVATPIAPVAPLVRELYVMDLGNV